MNTRTAIRPRTSAKALEATRKRTCATCGRRLTRIWDREAQTAEFLCINCTCFIPTDMNRR